MRSLRRLLFTIVVLTVVPACTGQAVPGGRSGPRAAATIGQPSPDATATGEQPAPQAPVAFAPLGGFSTSLLAKLATHFEHALHVQIDVLPRVSLGSAFDPVRRQLVAEDLLDELDRAYPDRAENADVALIGFTRGDMYTRRIPEWSFAFGSRFEDHLGVISTGRMAIGLRPFDQRRFESRVRKMTLRYLGLLHFKYEFTTDPSSVLYEDLLGLEDLDRMRERL